MANGIEETAQEVRPEIIREGNKSADKDADVDIDVEDHQTMEPLLIESAAPSDNDAYPIDGDNNDSMEQPSPWDRTFQCCFPCNPLFCKRAIVFLIYYVSIALVEWRWSSLQRTLMTMKLEPIKDTKHFTINTFPWWTSFPFLCGRSLSFLIAAVAMKARSGAWIFANNETQQQASIWAFLPIGLCYSIHIWSEHGVSYYTSHALLNVLVSLRPARLVLVVVLGKVINRIAYPLSKYITAMIIAIGACVFFMPMKTPDGDISNGVDEKKQRIFHVLILSLLASFAYSLAPVWQDKLYRQFGRRKEAIFQMMLGASLWAIVFTTLQLLLSGDLFLVLKFVHHQNGWFVVQYLFYSAVMSSLTLFLELGMVGLFSPVALIISWLTRPMIRRYFHWSPLSSLETTGACLVVAGILFLLYRDLIACRSSNGISIAREEYSITWFALASLLLASPILAPLLVD